MPPFRAVAGSTHLPVTQEIAGSNPVAPAKPKQDKSFHVIHPQVIHSEAGDKQVRRRGQIPGHHSF